MKTNYIFVDISPGQVKDVYASIQGRSEVTVISPVFGEHDLIAKVDVESLDDLYSLSNDINAMSNVSKTSVFPSFSHKTNGIKPEELENWAWTLVSYKGKTDAALEKIIDLKGVAYASAIAGEWNIIAMVCGDTFADIGKTALEILNLEGVSDTKTYPAFPSSLVEEYFS